MFYGNVGNYRSGGIWSGIKKSFYQGSSLTKLIYINIAVFLLIKLFNVLLLIITGGSGHAGLILHFLGLPAYWKDVLGHPWTLISYMFTHFEFFHLLFNCLWLYWFGKLFLNYFSEKKLTGVYILGGLTGALVFLLSYNFMPAFELSKYNAVAVGASASVMAIVFSVCFYIPQHQIYVFLIGPVKLIYLAMFTIFIDIISIPSSNAGGHLSHLGGALFGVLFVFAIKKNRDLTAGIGKFFDLFERQKTADNNPNRSVKDMNDSEYNEYKRRKGDEINRILDKISKSGYDSLTKKEKETLFKSGKS